MKFLVLLHVLSAIIGVGPTFFAHVLLRRRQTLEELRSSIRVDGKLEIFPKVGGTIAVITGLLLIWLGEYGPFTQLWVLGSLVLYVLIQVVVLGFAMPQQRKLAAWVLDPANQSAKELPTDVRASLAKASNYFYIASSLAIILFIFMILKPA